ncbi:hypothetical protein DFJ74DRAFT_710866 [Hyaloraphidium curvatum]|nr:hypothetical protein DFJ74DRAFT_710866 [Hyaloraphidium curvatum]
MGNALAPAAKTQLDLVRVMADDRSLFRALDAADYLAEHPPAPDSDPWARLDELGDDESRAVRADSLRTRVVDAMASHRTELESLLAAGAGDGIGGGKIDAYLAEMRNHWVPGGRPELSAAAQLFRRPIWVYRTNELGRNRPGKRYGEEYAGSEPVRLLWYGGASDIALKFSGRGHYALLVPASW